MFIIRRLKLYYTASGVITLKREWSKITKIQFYKYEQIVVKLEKTIELYFSNFRPLTYCKTKKKCASSWLITEVNILRCTVSKT